MFAQIDFGRIADFLSYNPKEPLVFNSGVFLATFFVFLLLHQFFYRHRAARIGYITLFSLYFYYKSTGFYFVFLLVTSLIDFVLARMIHDSGSPGKRKAYLIISIATNLALLGYFKYTNFFVDTINAVSSGNISHLDIFLPAGISFYTFQSLSYTIDVYRRELEPLKHYSDFCFCVSFFPHLVAGPIIRASYIIPQIGRKYQISRENMGRAVFLIVGGLFKKAVIADYISLNFVDRVFQEPLRYSGVENLMAVYSYALQIYCDFSGYSDMAIGIALLIGFSLPDNFNSPYQSASITEFWRRWHISLSTWLKDYLYISLGGNRNGRIAQYRNLIITMLMGGLWHGASWKFIFWGGIHGVVLALEKLFNIPRLVSKNPLFRLGGILVTFHIVCFSWVFFRAESFGRAWEMIIRIATGFNPAIFQELVRGYAPVFILMGIGFLLHFAPKSTELRFENMMARSPLPVKACVIVAMIFLVIQVKSSEIQPFIYFQF